MRQEKQFRREDHCSVCMYQASKIKDILREHRAPFHKSKWRSQVFNWIQLCFGNKTMALIIVTHPSILVFPAINWSSGFVEQIVRTKNSAPASPSRLGKTTWWYALTDGWVRKLEVACTTDEPSTTHGDPLVIPWPLAYSQSTSGSWFKCGVF